jgi:hypothetical protein
VAHSAKADSALWPIARNELKVEYLGEIEVIFEMALGNDSGDQVGLIHEKPRGRKSRDTIPLMYCPANHIDELSAKFVFCILKEHHHRRSTKPVSVSEQQLN